MLCVILQTFSVLSTFSILVVFTTIFARVCPTLAQPLPQATTIATPSRPFPGGYHLSAQLPGPARVGVASAFFNSSFAFAGGLSSSVLSSRVDLFDPTRQAWMNMPNTQLSEARYGAGAAATASNLFVCGGLTLTNASAVCDVFDRFGKASVSTLSAARGYTAMVGFPSLVVVAGGLSKNFLIAYSNVDIFSAQGHTTATLSVPRGFLVAVLMGTKAAFCGGLQSNGQPSSACDIFDSTKTSGAWAAFPTAISIPRSRIAGAFSNGVLFLAGMCGPQTSS